MWRGQRCEQLFPHTAAQRSAAVESEWGSLLMGPAHDPASAGLRLDDDPIVPPGIQDPPVVRSIEKMRQTL